MSGTLQINPQQSVEKQSVARLQENIPSKSLVNFAKPAKNILRLKYKHN